MRQYFNTLVVFQKFEKIENVVFAQKVAAKASIWTIFCGISSKSPEESFSGVKTAKFAKKLFFELFSTIFKKKQKIRQIAKTDQHRRTFFAL